jgi:enoyl-CoA hydratase
MSETDVLVTEINNAVAYVTLNRPSRLNTLNRRLMAELRSTFADLAVASDVRVIIVRGEGERAFCAGADIKEPHTHEYESLQEYMREQPGIFELMLRCPQVIISEVNGWAVGGGFQLALFSDLIYASKGAKFKLPQASLGLLPPYGTTVRLARFIGQGRATQLTLLGTVLTAQDAEMCGLVQGVAEDPVALRRHVTEVVASLLEMSRDSVELTKDSMSWGWDMSVGAAAVADRYRSFALKQSIDTRQRHDKRREALGGDR